MLAGVKKALSRAAGILLLPPLLAGCGDPDAFNLVLISIDTLAARHLGLYGYARDTSPNLDRYARDSIVFMNAYSTAPKTAESHMSMFTSLYPSVHGVFSMRDRNKIDVLDQNIQTLPEILKKNGYTTVGFHGNGFVDGPLGFGRGFDEYRLGTQRDAEAWLEKNASTQKFFLFHHTYRVHDPYVPKPPFDERFGRQYEGPIVHDLDKLIELSRSQDWGAYSRVFWKAVDKSDPDEVARLVALYDGAIAEMDDDLARLLAAIERHAPRTIVVILSDHGEEFDEHGRFKHEQMYDEILHVPLIIRQPDGPKGVRVESRVSLIDLAPTILEMLSIPAPQQFQGHSLLDRLETGGGETVIFSEFPAGERRALVSDDRKLIVTGAREEIYDLMQDPGERRDLSSTGPGAKAADAAPDPKAALLRKELIRISGANASARSALGVKGSKAELDDRTLRRLRALGYIE